MSNSRNGGVIIIGVNDKNKPEGMTDEQVNSFENFEEIKRYIDSFASTSTDFEIYCGELNDYKFVVFIVQDFYETPIICKKNGLEGLNVLKQDMLYARSLKPIYSSKMAGVYELKEIINLAVDKETQKLRERGWTRDCPYLEQKAEQLKTIKEIEKYKEFFDKEIEDME